MPPELVLHPGLPAYASRCVGAITSRPIAPSTAPLPSPLHDFLRPFASLMTAAREPGVSPLGSMGPSQTVGVSLLDWTSASVVPPSDCPLPSSESESWCSAIGLAPICVAGASPHPSRYLELWPIFRPGGSCRAAAEVRVQWRDCLFSPFIRGPQEGQSGAPPQPDNLGVSISW